jgi:hypothetical protein
MRERPILFTAPMVRGILEGRKTQTRRVVKGVSLDWLDNAGFEPAFVASPENGLSPYGFAGDTLWGRENFRLDVAYNGTKPSLVDSRAAVFFEAGGQLGAGVPGKLRPAIHMPRYACRLVLPLADVRIERLNDCSEEDALAEGVVWSEKHQWFHVPGVAHPNPDFPVLARSTAREMYAALWDTISGSGAWLGNPWVWVLDFRPLQLG